MMFVLMTGCQVRCDWDEGNARRNADQFLSDRSLSAEKRSCSGTDSDGDGYSSCTAVLANGQRWPLECSTWEGGGCRERSLVNVIGQQPTE